MKLILNLQADLTAMEVYMVHRRQLLREAGAEAVAKAKVLDNLLGLQKSEALSLVGAAVPRKPPTASLLASPLA